MAPHGTMNKEQEELLEQYREHYMSIHASTKRYGQFWSLIRQQWFQKWPAADTLYPGCDPGALNPLEVETVRRYIASQMKTITNWYRWRANINNRTGARAPKLASVLRKALSDTTVTDRALCDWQMYSVHHYDERVKAGVDEELALLSLQNNGEPIARGERIKLVVRHIKEKFANETQETRENILNLVAQQHEKKAAMKATMDSACVPDIDGVLGVTDMPKLDSQVAQRTMNSIPNILDRTFSWIYQNSGFYVSAVFVGPDPRNQKLVSGSFHYGKDHFGNDFGTAYKGFNESVMNPYTTFVQRMINAAKPDNKVVPGQPVPSTSQTTSSSESSVPPPTSPPSIQTSLLPSSKQQNPSIVHPESSTLDGKLPITGQYRYHPNPAVRNIFRRSDLFLIDDINTEVEGSSLDELANLPPDFWGSNYSTDDGGSDTTGLNSYASSDADATYDSDRALNLPSSSSDIIDEALNSAHIHSNVSNSVDGITGGVGSFTTPQSSLLRFTTAEENAQRFLSPPLPPASLSCPPSVFTSLAAPSCPPSMPSPPFANPEPSLSSPSRPASLEPDLFHRLNSIEISILSPINVLSGTGESNPINSATITSNASVDLPSSPTITNNTSSPDLPAFPNTSNTSSLPIVVPPPNSTPTIPDASSPVFPSISNTPSLPATVPPPNSTPTITDSSNQAHNDTIHPAIIDSPEFAVGTNALIAAPSSDSSNVNLPASNTVRRSARSAIPSKRTEELSSIGSSTAVLPLAPSTSTVETARLAWITNIKNQLIQVQGGDTWVKCVENWTLFEEHAHYTTAKGYLPSTELRPSEWSSWVSNGRCLNQPPLIDEPVDFGLALTKWWRAMQPSFRRNGDGLLQIFADLTGESAEGWLLLRRGGPNGLSSIILMLSWWGISLSSVSTWSDDSSPAWNELVADVSSAIDAMSNEANASHGAPKGTKRKSAQQGTAGKRGKRGRGGKSA